MAASSLLQRNRIRWYHTASGLLPSPRSLDRNISVHVGQHVPSLGVVPQKSAFVIFPDVHSACAAAAALRNETHVDAVEMFDRASLRCGRLLLVCSLVYLPKVPRPLPAK